MKSQTLFRFVWELTNRGLLYAVANQRIYANLPLEAEENWNFWTQTKPAWLEWLAKNYPPESARKRYLKLMLKQAHAEGIEAHYDISNDFYSLFLDRKYRFYTCAEFEHDGQTLEEAQENKANYLYKLLNLEGNEKILDLGCGWGAMLKFLRDSGHQGELTGFTLSKEQLIYIQNSLGFNVSLTNFITDSFKDAPYERIYSIGALEHVKPHEIEKMYQKISDALVPGGLTVHQFFSLEKEPYPASMVLMQLFFPGSVLVMHSTHIEAAERAGFEITHDSIHDYKPTLRAWYERLVENRTKALSLVGLEIYNRYMTFFPIAWLFFAQKESNLHRIVMRKPVR
jgi:cyclopropane-fatty-acyl-phospholipid synthase